MPNLCRTSIVSLCALSCAVPIVAAAAQRTFVSTTGNDSGACTLAARCRSFGHALTTTDAGGEIIVLDSGGYGAVTINKSVTIAAPAGVYAGISVFTGADGITIVSPATNVVLRGLAINGQGGNDGIRVQAGDVRIENVVASNLAQAGVLVEGGTSVHVVGTVARSNADGVRVVPASGSVAVLVHESELSDNATAGVNVSPTAAGASAHVVVEHTSANRNGTGFAASPTGSAIAELVVDQSVASANTVAGVSSAGTGATVYVRQSAITRNNIGLAEVSPAVLNSCGANLIIANATAQSGTIGTASCIDVASASGTVTSVATAAGLTGGPITTSGTIGLAATNLLPTVACAVNQIPKWNGSAWACAADASGTGTVTSIATGAGLTGGPISTSGTIAIANGGVGNSQIADGAVSISKLDTASTDRHYATIGGNALGVGFGIGTADDSPFVLLANNRHGLTLTSVDIAPYGGVNVVAGSPLNAIDAGVVGGTISGGGALHFLSPQRNEITTGNFATIGGGVLNLVSADGATVGGGNGNAASGAYSTIAGGSASKASAVGATVAGGTANLASGLNSAVGGGLGNAATGNAATVAGGLGNNANGDYSVAMGRNALTTNGGIGSFVFSDSTGTVAFGSGNPNEFLVGATGGIGLFTVKDYITGCKLAAGSGTWNCSSSRDLKRDFETVDTRAILTRVAALPMASWRFKTEPARVRHVGPMAQDFRAAFGLGIDDVTIATVDEEGIALAAIQGLNAKMDDVVQAKERELTELRDALAALKDELRTLARVTHAP